MKKLSSPKFLFSKKYSATHYFTCNAVKKFCVVFILACCFSIKASASSYTVSTNVNATTLSSRTEDTLYIDAVVTINTNETWNFKAVIMRGPNGTIFWANNTNLSLPICEVFNIETSATAAPGLQPTGGNASKLLLIAGVKVAVSNDNSNNAAFSFDEFTYLGGLPKFTLTSNSPVCNGNSISVTATPDRSSTILYNYNWTITPISGTFNPVSSNSTTSATTVITPSAGTYTVTCSIYATSDPLATVTTTVTVNALPLTPTSVSASPATVCAGSTSNLKGTSTSNTIKWYTVASGGTGIGTSASGTNFPVIPGATTTYYAEALSSAGCKSTARTAVTSTVNALPTAFAVTGGGSYCSGGSGVVIGLSGSQTGVNYQLYNAGISSGSAVAGTGSAITFGNKTVAGTYSVIATNATTTCTNTMTGNAVVTIISRPTSTIGPASQSVCNGSAASITASLSGTAPWTLTYSDGSASSTVNNIAASPYTFNLSPLSTKTYTITSLSDASCTSIAADRTGSAPVTVNKRPTAAISGTTTICNGSSATLSLAVSGAGTITGTLSDGTAFSGTAPAITINVNPSTTTIYTVATLSNNTCTAIAADKTGSATITVNQRPTASLSGTTAICNGSLATLSLAVTGSGTISGTLSDGSAFNGTAPTITIDVNPGTSTIYTVATLSNSTCTSIAADRTGSAIVTVNQRPTAFLSGTTTLCNGTSATLSLAVAGSGTIAGTLSDGSAFSGTAPAISLNVAPNTSTTYAIATLYNNTCTSITADKSGSATITVNQRPTSIISGTTTICNGSSATLSLAVTGTGTISGTLSDGTAFGGTAPAITINVNPGTTTTYTFATLSNNTCTSIAADRTGSAIVTVNQRPTAFLSGTTTICNGNQATLSLAVTGSGTLSGALSDGTAFSGNTPAISVNVNPNAATTYNITTLSNSTCTSIAADRTGSAVIKVNQRPSASISGLAAICKGSSVNINLSVIGTGIISGSLSDGTTFSGTAPAINVNVSPLTSTTYTIANLTNESCTSTSADLTGTFVVTLNDPVAVTINTEPLATTFCAGSNTAFYVNASGAGTLIYKWQVSTNGITYIDVSGNSYAGANTNSLILVNPAASLNESYYRVIVSSSLPCPVPDTSIAVQLLLTNYWTGTTSSDWNTASNWSGNTVPTLNCADVYISGGALYQPSLTTGIITVNNIIIKAGASLTINGIMQVAGTITNAGILDVQQGTIEFNGTSVQSIPANVFKCNTIKSLVVSNNVLLEGAVSLTGTLSFGSTGKTLSANGYLTLKSSAENTAAVGQIINGNNITGDVIVERYFTAKRAWRLLSVPTQTIQSVKSAWQEGAQNTEENFISGYGTQVTNNTATWQADGFDYYSPDGPSVKRYDAVTKKYIGLSNTSASLASTEGWMTFIRGDRTSVGTTGQSTPAILRSKGSLFTGTQAAITVLAGAFKSVGNPYACAIDMRKITKSGIQNVFYVWDPYLGNGLGGFQTFTPGSDGNYKPSPGFGSYASPSTPYNFIQSGAAFFVLGNALPAANGTITFTENAKAGADSANVLLHRNASPNAEEAIMRTNLYAINNESFSLIDGTSHLFSDTYNNDVDLSDASKIPNFNSSEDISIINNGKLLAVEKRHAIQGDDTIRLNIQNLKARSYKLEFTAQGFDPALRVFLEDHYYHTITPLKIDGKSGYAFTVTDVEGSNNENRFRIVFRHLTQNLQPTIVSEVKAHLQNNNDVIVDWKVRNENNIKRYDIERSADRQHYTLIASLKGRMNECKIYQWLDVNALDGNNYYRIKSVAANEEVVYSNTVNISTVNKKSGIAVYPNPVKGGRINLQLINQPKGIYNITLINEFGQVLLTRQIENTGNDCTKILQVKNINAYGICQLLVTGPGNHLMTYKIQF